MRSNPRDRLDCLASDDPTTAQPRPLRFKGTMTEQTIARAQRFGLCFGLQPSASRGNTTTPQQLPHPMPALPPEDGGPVPAPPLLTSTDRRKLDKRDDALFDAEPRFVGHLDGGCGA